MTDAMIGIGGRWWKFPGARIDSDSWEGEWRGDGRLYLHDGVGNVVEGTEVDNPEMLAVLPLPSADERERREITMNGIEIAVSMMDDPDISERRRRELALVRLMAVAIDVILNTGEDGLDVRIETAKDLVREIKHVYSEACDV